MNKEELIEELAKQTGESKKSCKAVLDAFMQAVGESLGKDQRITLIGFGSFYVVETQARTGRNPRTGEPLAIKKKKKVKFKAGADLTDKVN